MTVCETALLYVSLPHATFGLVLSEAGYVVDAPPIARYTMGWAYVRCERYFRTRRARMELVR